MIEQREIGRDAKFEGAGCEDEDADCVFISSMHTPRSLKQCWQSIPAISFYDHGHRDP